MTDELLMLLTSYKKHKKTFIRNKLSEYIGYRSKVSKIKIKVCFCRIQLESIQQVSRKNVTDRQSYFHMYNIDID